ncbi:MAG: FRG domain-containing protein [Ruminococcus sp.]|nr:FRG domain-containing protein [Ruminococcus sp.]
MDDSKAINIIKEHIQKLLKLLDVSENSEKLIEEVVYYENIEDLKELITDNLSDDVKKNYEKILRYECSNTKENLDEIYKELDNIQAEIAISQPSDQVDSGSGEEGFSASDIDVYINSFVEKGVNKDDIKSIESLTDYIDFIHKLDLNYLSRGQGDCSWPLLPSALRKNGEGNRIYSDDDVNNMLQEFTKTLVFYDKNYTRTRNELEVQAYAQHYSIPTYLIDFTESHLISILFAIEDYESDSCSVIYFVDAKKFNANKCRKYSIPNCSEFAECDGGASPIFIKSDSVNERIHFQKGCFLRIPNNYEKDDLILDLKDFCKVVLIAKENKYELLSDLFKLGLGFHNIYPDLDNNARTIKFKNKLQGDVL